MIQAAGDNRRMPASLQLCMAVSRLRAEGFRVAAIARELSVTEAEVEEVHHVLMLPSVDSILEDRAARAGVTPPTDDQRAAELERMPKKMQDRIRKSRV